MEIAGLFSAERRSIGTFVKGFLGSLWCYRARRIPCRQAAKFSGGNPRHCSMMFFNMGLLGANCLVIHQIFRIYRAGLYYDNIHAWEATIKMLFWGLSWQTLPVGILGREITLYSDLRPRSWRRPPCTLRPTLQLLIGYEILIHLFAPWTSSRHWNSVCMYEKCALI